MPDDLRDEDGQADEEHPGQARKRISIVAIGEKKLEREAGYEQQCDAREGQVAGQVVEAESRPVHAAVLSRRSGTISRP